jgi:hypothetical protein
MSIIFRIRSLVVSLLALMAFPSLEAQVPHMINYQGRIVVDGANFSGEGQFKFALVNGAGDVTYWSHDGSSAAGVAPGSHLVLTVTAGLYSILLGDATVMDSDGEAMQAITSTAFDNPEVRLRIWFNDGANGFQLLAPDRRIAAVAYALMADSVPDGSITTEKLADGSVTSDKLAPAAGGNLKVSLSSSDPELLDAGYTKVQSIPAPPWRSVSSSGAPSPRSRHTAIWTGSGMIVWGGRVGNTLSNQGGIYHPETGLWEPLPTSGTSPARSDHTAVWTGDRMILWGGFTNSGESRSGAFYAPPVSGSDPPIGGWLATTLSDAPVARSGHTAVWADTKMIIWGGKNGNGLAADGAAYSPPSGPLIPGSEGSWSPIETSNAPSSRHQHTVVWTGTKMIVWGGLDGNFDALASGGIYDPTTDLWTPVPSVGAPSPRTGHTAVWTGTKMLIFGGSNTESPGSVANLLADGAAFDPESGEWTPLANAGFPLARYRHGAVWTGTEMLVFGGELTGGNVATSGAAYRPNSDSWRSLPNAPETRASQTGVWSGAELLVFGTNGLHLLDPAPAVHFYGKF